MLGSRSSTTRATWGLSLAGYLVHVRSYARVTVLEYALFPAFGGQCLATRQLLLKVSYLRKERQEVSMSQSYMMYRYGMAEQTVTCNRRRCRLKRWCGGAAAAMAVSVCAVLCCLLPLLRICRFYFLTGLLPSSAILSFSQ